ncbi:MAG: alanine dehydrogenase [Lewinellaceae bacterium]|nr:alanine dehydrogenase [Saprospiraceae bacterium]MCB9308234.1 alanine dehydrogenase [Lewinellaceae bacterium]MCB9355082.1 alanine dehydrogenase [Lewinellaceae bacterium]
METLSVPRTKAEMLQVHPKQQRLFIGIPRETTLQENRVALVPHSVATLTAHGHKVVVETGAGEKTKFTDHDYSEAGAEIAHSREDVFKADVLLKVAPPVLEEVDLMRPNQVLISPIHLPLLDPEYIVKLQKKRVIALAMEYIRDDDTGMFPIVHVMSEIAGISAILIAAELLATTRGGKGVLLGGIAGVPPAKVIILGAGVVAEFSTRTALGLGAEVRIIDNNVYKLMRLQNQVGRQLHTSVVNPAHLREQLLTADVAIGAVHSRQGRTPVLVSDDIVRSMKPGSVIVDVSIDQGGCFETSVATTHEKPTFEKHGVIHYCVPNIASRVAGTASDAISNILTSLLLKAESGGILPLITSHEGLRNGVYTYKGCLTNTYLGERFDLKSTSLDLLITSDF